MIDATHAGIFPKISTYGIPSFQGGQCGVVGASSGNCQHLGVPCSCFPVINGRTAANNAESLDDPSSSQLPAALAARTLD